MSGSDVKTASPALGRRAALLFGLLFLVPPVGVSVAIAVLRPPDRYQWWPVERYEFDVVVREGSVEVLAQPWTPQTPLPPGSTVMSAIVEVERPVLQARHRPEFRGYARRRRCDVCAEPLPYDLSNPPTERAIRDALTPRSVRVELAPRSQISTGAPRIVWRTPRAEAQISQGEVPPDVAAVLAVVGDRIEAISGDRSMRTDIFAGGVPRPKLPGVEVMER